MSLSCWVDCLIDQASDGHYFDRKKNQWVAGLDLEHSKLFILILVKLYKKKEIKRFFARKFARNYEQK